MSDDRARASKAELIRRVLKLDARSLERLDEEAHQIASAARAIELLCEARQRVARAREQSAQAECKAMEQMLRARDLKRELLSRSSAPNPGMGGLQWEITDSQIERLAVKAVTQFARLSGDESERAWALWRRELTLRLPPLAAAEVLRRADELRRMS